MQDTWTDTISISIHALREEGDPSRSIAAAKKPYFYPRPPRGGRPAQGSQDGPAADISIHALREEGDVLVVLFRGAIRSFLSTPSARRATGQRTRASLERRFLSTPSARRATHPCRPKTLFLKHFYPRPPRGGRPRLDGSIVTLTSISIHALREEGDSKNGEKHLRFCFIIKRSAQIWKSLSKNIRKNSCDLHRTA